MKEVSKRGTRNNNTPHLERKVSVSLRSSLGSCSCEILPLLMGGKMAISSYNCTLTLVEACEVRKLALAPVEMYQASLCFLEPIGLYSLITDYIGRKQPRQEHLFTKKTFSSLLKKNQLFLSPSNSPRVPCSCSPTKQ